MTSLAIVLDESGCASPQIAGCRESVRLATRVALRNDPGSEIAVLSSTEPQPRDGWVLLLEAADRLAPEGLAHLLASIEAAPDAVVVIGDHVRLGEVLDERSHHPAWSYEFLLSAAYVECAVAVRADVLADLFPLGLVLQHRDGLVLDVLLRVAESGRVAHQCPDVVVQRHGERIDADRHRSLVAAHLARVGVAADIGLTDHGTLHVRRADQSGGATVSIIIPTRGSAGRVWGRSSTWVVEAVGSIVATSSWPDLEFVVVADDETPDWVRESLERVAGARLRWVRWSEEFNFSAKVNAGVAAATGDIILLLNDDTRLIDADAIGEMAALLGSTDPATGSRVGVVGARLLFEDGTLQHAGKVYQEHPLHVCVGWPGDHPGPGRRLWATRECTGITAAALMCARTTFDEVGGFPIGYPLDFNDVWFCLAVRAMGQRIVWTPHASWFHFEGRTRERGPRADEYRALHDRWGVALDQDPYYHPDLQPRRADWVERADSRWWNGRGAHF